MYIWKKDEQNQFFQVRYSFINDAGEPLNSKQKERREKKNMKNSNEYNVSITMWFSCENDYFFSLSISLCFTWRIQCYHDWDLFIFFYSSSYCVYVLFIHLNHWSNIYVFELLMKMYNTREIPFASSNINL